MEAFERAQQTGQEISDFARRLGEDVLLAVNEEGRTEEYTLNEIHKIMATSTVTFFQASAVHPSTEDALSVLNTKIRALFTQLEELSSVSSDLSQAMEFERQPAPWLLRAQELKSVKIVSPDAEEEIRRLKTDLHERSAAVGERDKTVEEQSIKIELLESRMKDSGKKATLVKELEARLEEAKAKEKELSATLEAHLKDHEQIQKERNEYRTQLEKSKRASDPSAGAKGGTVLDPQAQAAALASVREVETLRAEITSLQAAVRFLREENYRATIPHHPLWASNDWLQAPLVKPKPSAEEQRIRKAAVEAQDVLNNLLTLTKETKVLELSKETERSKWRPAKSTPKYQAMRLRE